MADPRKYFLGFALLILFGGKLNLNPGSLIGQHLNPLFDFLAANGWYLIFAVIIVYNLQPHVEKFLDDRHQRVSMAESRRPERENILNRERERIRAEQQTRAEEQQQLHQRQAAVAEAKRKLARAEGKKGGEYNAMMGDQSGGGYKPETRASPGGGG